MPSKKQTTYTYTNSSNKAGEMRMFVLNVFTEGSALDNKKLQLNPCDTAKTDCKMLFLL